MQRCAIVIPCYNEAERLSLDAFARALDSNSKIDFCFVDDGSTDSTSVILNKFREGREQRVSVVQMPANSGKAEAVRAGVTHVLAEDHYDVVGYWDADISTPLTELPRLLELISNNDQYVMLSGCRVRRLGAEIQRHWYRHYLGRVFATVVSLMLKLPTYDTQCGAKLFRVEYARPVFAKPFVSRWFFDVELFCRIEELLGTRAASQRILEAPLDAWIEKKGSKLTLADYLRVPIDLGRIKSAYRLGGEQQQTKIPAVRNQGGQIPEDDSRARSGI